MNVLQPNIERRVHTTPHQNISMEMADTTILPLVGLGSMAQSSGLLEIAVRLCLNQSKQLCPHIWVPILKPVRPCIRPAVSKQLSSNIFSRPFFLRPLPRFVDDLSDDEDDDDVVIPVRNKRVFFADSVGFSLTTVRVFSDEEEESDLDFLPSLKGLGGMQEESYCCTISTCCPGTKLKLGFHQPAADFQSFRAKLAESMITLESCTLTDQTLQGTMRVRNLSFQKDVSVRITFDSWQSYTDVACTYLQERYGGPETDIFEFNFAIPKVIDAKRKIEFCLRYLPEGHVEPFWDNNNGKNYSIMCASSHLCHGNNPSERA